MFSRFKLHEKSNPENLIEKKKIGIDTEEFKNITSNILKTQNYFRQSDTLCDVMLLADDGVKIPAHKVILASGSPVFLLMFSSNFKEKHESIVSIKDIDSDILETIVKYIYTLELDITEKNIEKFLKAVHFFNLDGCVDKCCDFIENVINLENCLNFMKMANLFSYQKLYNLSLSFILDNFPKIKESSLYELCLEQVQTLISNNYLVIQSEDQVYNFVIGWTKFDEKNRKQFLWDLIKFVRFPYVTSGFFTRIFDEPLLLEYQLGMASTMETMLNHFRSPEYPETFEGLTDVCKRRIPRHLNKPNVLIAIDNYDVFKGVSYLKTNINYSNWISGSKIFIPPNQCSKIVSLENGIIFSIGGESKLCTSVISDVYILDLSQFYRGWVNTTPMNYARKHFGVCIRDNKSIYVVGGVDDDGDPLSSIEVYDIVNKTWKLLTTMLTPRSHCSAVYHKNILYVVGGRNDESNLLIIECFNESLMSWINSISQLNEGQMYNIGLTVDKDILYVVGGCNHRYQRNLVALNTLFKYDINKNKGWSRMTLMKHRQNSSAVIINDNIFIVGGKDPDLKPIPYTEIYDTKHCSLRVHLSELTTHALNVIALNDRLMDILGIWMKQ